MRGSDITIFSPVFVLHRTHNAFPHTSLTQLCKKRGREVRRNAHQTPILLPHIFSPEKEEKNACNAMRFPPSLPTCCCCPSVILQSLPMPKKCREWGKEEYFRATWKKQDNWGGGRKRKEDLASDFPSAHNGSREWLICNDGPECCMLISRVRFPVYFARIAHFSCSKAFLKKVFGLAWLFMWKISQGTHDQSLLFCGLFLMTAAHKKGWLFCSLSLDATWYGITSTKKKAPSLLFRHVGAFFFTPKGGAVKRGEKKTWLSGSDDLCSALPCPARPQIGTKKTLFSLAQR